MTARKRGKPSKVYAPPVDPKDAGRQMCIDCMDVSPTSPQPRAGKSVRCALHRDGYREHMDAYYQRRSRSDDPDSVVLDPWRPGPIVAAQLHRDEAIRAADLAAQDPSLANDAALADLLRTVMARYDKRVRAALAARDGRRTL